MASWFYQPLNIQCHASPYHMSDESVDINLDSQNKGDQPPGFKSRRLLIFLLNASAGAVVYFHRHLTTVVAEPMAASYNVEVQKISIFSSMFYYAFGFIQPFAGIIADIIEPGYIVGIGSLLSAIGAFICGVSNSILVGSVGRILTGLGCSQIYICTMKCCSNWYELKYFGYCGGFFNLIAGIGAILSQAPLAAYADIVGWRWSFHTIGFIGVILAVLAFIFVRGNPESYGFNRVNEDCEPPAEGAKAKFAQMWDNIKMVVKSCDFWLLAGWALGTYGSYFDISGMWAGPYLTSVYGFTSQKAGLSMISFSVGQMIFSLFYPMLSNRIKTKKWIGAVGGYVSALLLFPLIFCGNLSFWSVTAIFFWYSATGNTPMVVIFPLGREYFPSSAAATAISFINAAAFISGSTAQIVTGIILKKYGINDQGQYSAEGYKYGLYWFCVALSLFGSITLSIAKDSMLAFKDETKVIEKEESQEIDDDLRKELNEINEI